VNSAAERCRPRGFAQAAGWAIAVAACAGCHHVWSGAASCPDGAPLSVADGAPAESVVFLPVQQAEWTWEQIADVVDDYFRIERERPVQTVGNVVSEGRIDVFPQIGATALEPHRADSVGWFNCWQSTLQTIRRRASIVVTPDGNGWLVRATVWKDVEDLPRPEHSTAGGATFRNDDSLPTRSDDDVSRTQLSNAWVQLGRDVELERQMLAEMQARVSGAMAPP
jgi:hypothetical protein